MAVDITQIEAVGAYAAGPDFQASGITDVTGTLSAAAASSSFTPKAGRGAFLVLTGGTSLTGALQWSLDGGTTWANIATETQQIGLVAYIAAGGNLVIPLPLPDKNAARIRLNATAVAGTVSYVFTQ